MLTRNIDVKVITMDKGQFKTACKLLRAQVDRAGYRPDGIIAIATGGIYVADECGYPGVRRVTLRRKGTKAKRKLLDRVIKRLPRKVNDALRILESRVLEITDRRDVGHYAPVSFSAETLKWLSTRPKRLLVIDDAVDSGHTLLRVVESLRSYLPDATILTAVITTTRRNPVIRPDFTLYSDQTLVRFPWSADS